MERPYRTLSLSIILSYAPEIRHEPENPLTTPFMKALIIAALAAVAPATSLAAEEDTDTLQPRQLDEVVVEARLQRTSATVSTYIPTAVQRNSAQTGSELLDRMAIPQLGLVTGSTVTTSSGQAVALFINHVPASEQDLSGMRMADVKKVEYYDYPADPRFLGKEHVINFVMQQYSYGGYVKAYANEFFIANSGQLNIYSKLQRGRMTYDLAVGGYYSANDRLRSDTRETFRLPDATGGTSPATIERLALSDASAARVRDYYMWPTLRVLYSSDRATISNTLGASFNTTPRRSSAGEVAYDPAVYPASAYASDEDSRSSSATYSGNWHFKLPGGNSLSFNPYYSFIHTRRHSLYTESGTPFANDATDRTHQATAQLRLVHDFGTAGTLSLLCNGFFRTSRTRYSGTATAADRLTNWRVGPGVYYNYAGGGKFSAGAGAGVNFDDMKSGATAERTSQPWADCSLQYAFSSRSSVSADFHYSVWTPSGVYRSSAVIHTHPLFSYTGNPSLRPYHSYDLSLRYVWMPRNGWNFSAFTSGYLTPDRFAFDYVATPTGVLRAISQHTGRYTQLYTGISGTVKLLGNSLTLNGQAAWRTVYNGAPYDITRNRLLWHLQAFYYTGAWNFGVQYQSSQAYSDGFMNPSWSIEPCAYTAIAGWGNTAWSLQCRLTNPFRWHWKAGSSEMKSPAYDITTTYYNTSYHCYILLSATYTLGFGKKIQQGGEAFRQAGTTSGILR